MNRSYSLNSLCPKIISNWQVFRNFEVLLYIFNQSTWEGLFYLYKQIYLHIAHECEKELDTASSVVFFLKGT